MDFLNKFKSWWQSESNVTSSIGTNSNIPIPTMITGVGSNTSPVFKTTFGPVNIQGSDFDSISIFQPIKKDFTKADIIEEIRRRNRENISKKLRIPAADAAVIEENLWKILSKRIIESVNKVIIPELVKMEEAFDMGIDGGDKIIVTIDGKQHEYQWMTTTDDKVTMLPTPDIYFNDSSDDKT